MLMKVPNSYPSGVQASLGQQVHASPPPNFWQLGWSSAWSLSAERVGTQLFLPACWGTWQGLPEEGMKCHRLTQEWDKTPPSLPTCYSGEEQSYSLLLPSGCSLLSSGCFCSPKGHLVPLHDWYTRMRALPSKLLHNTGFKLIVSWGPVGKA